MTRLFLIVNLACKACALFLWFDSFRVLAVAVFVAPDLVLLYHLLVPSAQGLVPIVTRFETDRSEVWLTIDDGPDECDTPRILDLLDLHGAKATFFVIGERAARHPQLVSEILRRGNEVAHHTHTHPAGTFWCASPSRVARELDDGLRALAASGVAPRWFRPPVGIKNLFLRSALRRRGLVAVGWSVRSRDCLGGRVGRIRDRVMRGVRPGSIIVMHEGRSVPAPVRVRAIAEVLAALREGGFRCIVPGKLP